LALKTTALPKQKTKIKSHLKTNLKIPSLILVCFFFKNTHEYIHTCQERKAVEVVHGFCFDSIDISYSEEEKNKRILK